MIESILNTIFSPIMGLNPMLSILIICIIINGSSSLVNKKLLGKTNIKDVKDKMQKARAEMLEAQKSGDKGKIDIEMKKMMEMNSEYMQSMIKPLSMSLVISMLLLILFFPWLKSTYNGMIVMTMPQLLPVIGGYGMTWIIWYIVCSIVISIALKKIMGM